MPERRATLMPSSLVPPSLATRPQVHGSRSGTPDGPVRPQLQGGVQPELPAAAWEPAAPLTPERQPFNFTKYARDQV